MARRRSLLNSGTRKTTLPSTGDSDTGADAEEADESAAASTAPAVGATPAPAATPEPVKEAPKVEPPAAVQPPAAEEALASFPPEPPPAPEVEPVRPKASEPQVAPKASEPESKWNSPPSFPPAMIEPESLAGETLSPVSKPSAAPTLEPPAEDAPSALTPMAPPAGLHSPRPNPISSAPGNPVPPGGQNYEEAATVAYPEYDDGPQTSAFDYDEAPPTEEVPNAVLQDISQPYSAPMHVPEPPPIPGIFDRFTPAGAQPRGRNAKVDRRPSYIAATPTPPPMLRSLEELEKPPPIQPRVRADDSIEPERGALPLVVFMAAFAVLVVLVMMFVIGMMVYNNQAADDGTISVEAPTPAPVERPVPVEPEPEPELPVEPVPEPAVGVPSPAPVTPPSPPSPTAPEPVRPQPVRPAPTPAPPAPAAPEPAAALGTVQINSNRRVMVYVDGKAIGFTPRTYKAPVGPLSVSAMIPRQPQSKQTQEVSVRGGATKTVDFTF